MAIIKFLDLVESDDVDVYDNGDITIMVESSLADGVVELYTTIDKLERVVKQARQALEENK